MNDSHTKHYEKWSRKEFEALPELDKWDEVNGYYGEIDCFVLIPTRKYHDSGFRIMDIVIVKDEKPIGRYADTSDSFQLVYRENPPYKWCMDCLSQSGLIRLWASEHTCKILSPFSTFEIQSSKQLKR